ncbi:hypothetical protein COU78_00705 [Candidatus Peregrinibacteria bacterium CG10_big_fil_rev_8_21_14_0_10_49_24]|nr:MAG: hypothetical protein COV83_00955 [Candidatus Peregrinibacteria bacterium CG11_big_fil_rev_8_21_14_0_20_49_14]PIR51473.1 MAG: hypothetical protein COU78_00705 [Candidatus Peregrinibacteria bacterium CG10_big_fil_rev_8_21_14_0_10_49_24]PJA67884.1 MAG: hypothetical protein CO157_02635 [Candidatus Peregrinibacteria bacterium CG_4_9_14_3_um_filter_49_12]
MRLPLRTHLPEAGLLLLGTFFCFRELGTFPAAWTDDSLFMIVARQLAEGKGYTLPLLTNVWPYPYILAVGPPLLFPVALAIKLAGFSVEAARIPMVIYIGLSALTAYVFTAKIADKNTARWSVALLLTLSTFINTGKTVMGEVPGFFFLLLGLLLLSDTRRTWKKDVGIGLLFGLSVLAKLTYGLIYPALGMAWLVVAVRKDKKELLSLTSIGLVAVAVYAPWRLLEMSSFTGLSKDFAFLLNAEEGGGFQILHGHLELLLRSQYLYYGLMLLLGGIGLLHMRRKLSQSLFTILCTLVVLCTLYFLSSFGWYRHLLPAHLLLIPFVVIGTVSVLPKRLASALLLFFVLGQSYWQLNHRGSSRSPAAAEGAAYVQEHLQDTKLIVQIAPIFVRLPSNPNWLFLTNPTLTSRLPSELVTLTEEQQCYWWVRGRQPQDPEDLQTVGRKYVLAPPAKDCP